MSDRSPVADALTRLRNLFLQGIALLAPLALTIALLVWLGHSVEAVVGGVLKHLLPNGWYLPGQGLVVGLLLTLVAGLLANLFLVRWLLNLLERVLDQIPLVKSLFQGLKDVARFFDQGGDKEMGRPVIVRLPVGDGEVQLVGFVMQEDASLPRADAVADGNTTSDGRIAVYLPMSYQVGGYTLYLDRARISPLDVGPEDALRAVLTGGALTRNARRRRSRQAKEDDA
jgi:uncharacterized membrane protein